MLAGPVFGTTTDVGFTPASLASDAALLAGEQSDEYACTSLAFAGGTANAADVLLSGFITTGTSPTAGKRLELWIVSKQRLAAAAYPDVFTGAGTAAKSATSRNVLQGICPQGPIWYQTIDSTSNRTYYFDDLSIKRHLEGIPGAFVAFLVHDTAVALHATAGNHKLSATPVAVAVN